MKAQHCCYVQTHKSVNQLLTLRWFGHVEYKANVDWDEQYVNGDCGN